MTPEDLTDHLREALGYLHDPYRLRRSPLAELFGVANRHDTPASLRRILTDAIEDLEPAPDTPDDSRAWRMYESLYYRYVEQFSQAEVAEQMGLSSRQVRREQLVALEALTYQLWSRFDLGELHAKEDEPPQAPSEAAVSEELAWLQETPVDPTTDLQEVVPSVVRLAQPLADRLEVTLSLRWRDPPPKVTIDAVGLRQILLNLLSVAMARGQPDGVAAVEVSAAGWDVRIDVETRGTAAHEPSALGKDGAAKLSLAEQLAQLCGARLEITTQPRRFSASVIIAGVAQIPVLVVDDNQGTLQLIQRYLQDTRYRLVEARQPEEAVPLAANLSPAVIVLDVMMPQVDGWEILGRLREHPQTRHIPVVVCTILAQKELALALGADGFLQKPFSRRVFLGVLNRQMARATSAGPR